MNQIISQHGWAFDSSLWKELKTKYINSNWIWQDNERGYFNRTSVSPKWINYSINGKKAIIIHSLGIHLIDKNTLLNASHAIFINSFYNFIPDNTDRRLIIRSLERMKKKLNFKEIKPMLNEFYKRSFFPNKVNLNDKKIISSKFNNVNMSKLKSDFNKLSITDNNPPLLVSKDCNVLIIKSINDRILNHNSSTSFIELMSKIQTKKIRILEIENYGHIVDNYKIFSLIDNWINKKYD